MLIMGDDLHVRNSCFHVTDAQGEGLWRGRFDNSEEGLRGFWGGLLERRGGEVEPVKVIVEATTNTRAAVQMLRRTAGERGIPLDVQVVNPRKLRVIAESVCKYDGADARVMNELGRSNLKLPTCYLADDEEFALREHLRGRSDLVQLRTMLKNRVHGLLHRRGVLTPEGGLFTANGRKFREQLQLDESGVTLLKRFEALIEALEKELRASDADLRRLARRERWAKSCALLQTIPGVGLITALTILAELGDLRRFKSRAAISNYAGLVPWLRSSNQTEWRGHITRQGSAHLRRILNEAAWVAVRSAPGYQALLDRIAVRRGKKIAIVAVSRRILEDAFVILKKQVPFRYVPEKSGAPCVDSETATRDGQAASSDLPAASVGLPSVSKISEVASSVAG